MVRQLFWQIGVLWVFVVNVAAGDEKFPAELVRFTPYQKNPVFTAAGPRDWDARIRERGWIVKHDSRYHLWYTGYDGTADGTRLLGYATSDDGLVWRRHSENPLVRNHWIEDMMVVIDQGVYYMFCEGLHDRAELLTSPDGVRWTKRGRLDVRLHDGRPIPDGPYGTPTVWVEDGVWRLFYERRDAGVWLASSRDRAIWTNVSDTPVLVPGPAAHEAALIALNQVIKHHGRYYAYYHGRGKAPQWSTNVAVSADLVRWEKYPQNPLLPAEDNKSSGIVVHDGVRYRLYTMHDRVAVHFSEPTDRL